MKAKRAPKSSVTKTNTLMQYFLKSTINVKKKTTHEQNIEILSRESLTVLSYTRA